MPRLTPRWILSLAIILLACAIDLLAFMLLRHPGPGTGARIAIALMPLPGDVAIIFLVLRAVRRLDEFQKRVHFEAVTVAFLATGVAVFVYGYLQQAQVVGALNTGLVWAFMLTFYGIGYLLAASHYR
jgi:uncharacterized membrane protein